MPVTLQVAMTFWEAAERVLLEANRPLSAHEILDKSASFIESRGKTPLASLQAILYVRAKRDDRLERVYIPGRQRAQRNSVKWRLMSKRRRSG